MSELSVRVMKREEMEEGRERGGWINEEKGSGGGDDGLECWHEIRERNGGQERGSDHLLVSLFDFK